MMEKTGNVTQKFYCNPELNRFIIITENKSADSRQICNIELEEIPQDSSSYCQISIIEFTDGVRNHINYLITEGKLIETNVLNTKQFIKKFERRSQELIKFSEL